LRPGSPASPTPNPGARYVHLLADAGLATTHTENHDDALTGMIDQIEARLSLLHMSAPTQLTAAGIDLDAVRHYTTLARRAITDGLLGYTLLIAENPGLPPPTILSLYGDSS